MKNSIHVEGRLYDFDLEKKVAGEKSKTPGVEYIRGSIKIATDEECMNVIEVFFPYSVEKNSKGSTNTTYIILNSIIEGKLHSVVNSSKQEAIFLRIDSSIALNDFYTVDKNTNKEALVSAKRIEGGFVNTATQNEMNQKEDARSTFEIDMFISNFKVKEADEEKGYPEKGILSGYIFDFKKSILPIEVSVLNPAAISYFTGLDINSKNPVFTCLKGKVISETVTRNIEEESAWGETSIKTVKTTNKDYVVTWSAPEPYELDDSATITFQEVQEALQNREIYLADVKRRYDDYKAEKNKASQGAFKVATNLDYKF